MLLTVAPGAVSREPDRAGDPCGTSAPCKVEGSCES